MDRQGALSALHTAVSAFARRYAAGDNRWCVALSGGPDSLALTAVAAKVKPTTALIVDHRLQQDSGRVAATAREHAMALGCVDAQIICVDVGTAGGPEAAARTARYRALDEARAEAQVLLGHTLDDQAETVLLGLGRGSGARSMAGMRPHHPPWGRPLLDVRRSVTHQACDELGIQPWRDPHNADRRYTRSRLRAEVMPLLEDVLGGGVAEALARTAIALREASGDDLDTARLTALPEAVRRRVIRGWLLASGAIDLTDKQIRGVDTLVTGWRGQGGVAVGSARHSERLFAGRRDGMLTLYREPVSKG
jgi:tRNA(Ile)-lysidine synthase